MRLFRLLLIFSLLFLVLLPPGYAAPLARVQMNVEAGFNGTFRNGSWLPVYVQLSNDGQAVEGEVSAEFSGGSRISTPVQLPTTSNKRITIHLLSDRSTLGSNRVIVRFIPASGQPIEQQINLNALNEGEAMVGVLAQNPAAFSAISRLQLKGSSRNATLVPMKLEMVEERHAILRAFDAIIINDFDTSSITPDRQAALAQWVREGGTLVLGSGPNWSKVGAGVLPDLLPVQPGAIRTISNLSGLAQWARSTLPGGGTYTVNVAQPLSGAQVLASQDGMPLIVQKQTGDGRTIWSALDLALDPIPVWNNGEPFWRAILSDLLAGPHRLNQSNIEQNINQPLRTMDQTPLPSLTVLWILLALYIIAIGPLNYILLKRMDRRELAWVTIPVLIIVATAAVYGSGTLLRGSGPLLLQITLLDVNAGNAATPADSYFAVYSPGENRYTLQVDGKMLAMPMPGRFMPNGQMEGQDASIVELGNGTLQIPDVAVRTGDARLFRATGSVALPGHIEANLTSDGSTVSGTLVNNTGRVVRNIYLVIGTIKEKVGDLQPGETKQVSFGMTSTTSALFMGQPLGALIYGWNQGGIPNQHQHQERVRRDILNALWMHGMQYDYGLRLVGWLDTSPVQVQIAGIAARHAQETIYTTLLPLEFTGQQSGNVPFSLITWEVLSRRSRFDYRPGFVLTNGETLAIEYTLPTNRNPFKVERFFIFLQQNSNFTTSGGSSTPPDNDELRVFAWDTGEWVSNKADFSNPIVLADSQRFISPDGRVRVQYVRNATSELAINIPVLNIDVRASQ